MIDPALIKLMRLQGRGMLRRIGRGARTRRGAAFFAVGVLMFGLWIASLSLNASGKRSDPNHVRLVAPLVLLGVCLLSAFTSAGEKAIAFTPGEVDFLFPGPFRRRELLAYKLAKSTLAALLTALVLSVAFRRKRDAVAGVLRRLVPDAAVHPVLQHRPAAPGPERLRARLLARPAGRAGGGGGGGAGRRARALNGRPLTGPGSLELTDLARQFARSEAGKVLLAPFVPFAQVITAQRAFPDLIGWSLVAAAIDAALVAAVVRLDANYLEAAAGATQRRYERLRRVRSGGVMSVGAGGTARRGLPQPPFLFGAGPVAWRQLTNATRSARGLLIVLVVLAGLCGPFLITSRGLSVGQPVGEAESILVRLFTGLAFMSVLAASLMKFDFRADLDPMESLKALPLRPGRCRPGNW